jgi:hypothetical protein
MALEVSVYHDRMGMALQNSSHLRGKGAKRNRMSMLVGFLLFSLLFRLSHQPMG